MNDGTPTVLARNIVLLLAASEHSGDVGKVDYDACLLWLALHSHLVLYAPQVLLAVVSLCTSRSMRIVRRDPFWTNP